VPRTRQLNQSEPSQRQVANRWTPALAALGWTPISDCFLANYHRLKITPLEAMVIVHLMAFKWDDAAPFPALRTVAKRMGVTPTSVRTHLRRLGQKNFVVREMTFGGTNRFHLQPLFRALEDLAARDQRATEKKSGVVKVELISNDGGLGKIVGHMIFTITDESIRTKSRPKGLLTAEGREQVGAKLSFGAVVGEAEGFVWRVKS